MGKLNNLIMSSPDINNSPPKTPKFTRGEKCIYIHLVATFLIILILIIIYFVHLCLVKHIGNDYYRVTRRSNTIISNENLTVYLSVGIAYINNNETSPRIICNTLLLKHRWSIAPAHCVLIRSDPKHSSLLPYWKIRYKNGLDELVETKIINGHSHSFFSKDDFKNNIGVFEHVDNIYSEELKFSDLITKVPFEDVNNMVVVGWSSWKNTRLTINKVRPLSKEMCSQLVMPIIEQRRDNEFCVVRSMTKNFELDHGAVVVMDSQTVGFFTWGDKNGKSVPFVILHIAPFKNWLEYAVSL